jgi:hypothetical protein
LSRQLSNWSARLERAEETGKRVNRLQLDELRGTLESMGFDGITYINVYEGVGRGKRERRADPANLTWLAFRPGQIKSAIGNSGLFLRESTSLTDRELSPASILSRAKKALAIVGAASIPTRTIESTSPIHPSRRSTLEGARP